MEFPSLNKAMEKINLIKINNLYFRTAFRLNTCVCNLAIMPKQTTPKTRGLKMATNKKTEKTVEKTTEKKSEKKALSFSEIIKNLKSLFFILFCDVKKELAIVKEKKIDISSPVNVLHVVNENGNITGNYEETILNEIGAENFFKAKRTSKGKYIVNPCLAGYLFHFCERIAIKIEAIRKANKGTKDISKLVKREIKCDLINLNKMINVKLCNLPELIAKDFPNVKGTMKNVLSSFIVVDNVEKGEISYITK